MIAALIKAAIFYWVFITIRKLISRSGILAGSTERGRTEQVYEAPHKHSSKPEDVIEADYRVID